MPERPQAIAFDFNGTLSDDEPILYLVYQELFTELGRPITHEQYLAELAGRSDEEMFRHWLGRSDSALVAERVARYNARVADGSTVDEETRAAVRLAATRVPTALVSLALRREIDPVLDATGLRPALTAIVSLEDVTRAKPDPEAYLLAAELLGVAPAAMVVVEDTAVGVAAARSAGARVVGLTRTLGAERLAAADELAERIDTALVERLLCS
jgi:beta-phosphoglucomutase-like phosphatase (HAD superfamily)